MFLFQWFYYTGYEIFPIAKGSQLLSLLNKNIDVKINNSKKDEFPKLNKNLQPQNIVYQKAPIINVQSDTQTSTR